MSDMHALHLGSLDLNLIVALDALLADRNVTRAAQRIGITQSAMSHSLARLRALTGDALLVRGPGGMLPTARALALGPPIRRALEEVTTALRSPAAFDPATVRQTVRIATSDYGELILLPRLAGRLAKEAPGIDLRVVPYTDDPRGVLGAGNVDVIVAPVLPRDAVPGIFSKKLFDEKFVCVVRKGHPLVRSKLTLARFAGAAHALISPRGREGSFVDDALARLGLSRRVAVAVPHFLVAPHVVAASDLILTVAARVAELLTAPLGLVVLEPPRELCLEGFSMSALWHERTHRDPAQKWLHHLLVEIASAS